MLSTRFLSPVLILVVLGSLPAQNQRPPSELYPFGTATFPSTMSTVVGEMHRRPVDIDGDGRHDLLKVGWTGINVALGMGNHAFQPWITTPVLSQITCAEVRYAVGDFNGDSHLDLAVGATPNPCYGPPLHLLLFLGDGTGGFASPLTMPTSGSAPPTTFNNLFQIMAGQIIPGGPTEIIICWGDTGPVWGNVDVLTWQNGGLSVAGTLPFSFSSDFLFFAGTGDFDGDGIDDLVGHHYNWPSLTPDSHFFVMHGSPNPPYLTLGPMISPATSDATFRLTGDNIRDVNNDGLADLVMPAILPSAVPSGAQAVHIAVGFGNPTSPLGSWAFTHMTHPCPSIDWFAVGDFDADGFTDATSFGFSGGPPNCSAPTLIDIAFYRGTGTGTFQRTTTANVANPNGFTAFPWMQADSDQDGDLDAWVAQNGSPVLWSENLSLTGTTTGAQPPRTTVGLPTPGNAAFFIGAKGLPPLSQALLALSAAPAAASRPFLPAVLVDPGSLLLPGILGSGLLTADAAGSVALSLPLPNLPSLRGLVLYTQAFSLAPQAFASSNLRRFVIW